MVSIVLAEMVAIMSADVIIIDPNRYAVAIRFNENSDEAPMIVAKGMDADATRIQQIARKNNVHSMESPLLAQSLCGTANRPICLPLFFIPLPSYKIPEEHYVAVAEILAYVHTLTKESTS